MPGKRPSTIAALANGGDPKKSAMRRAAPRPVRCSPPYATGGARPTEKSLKPRILRNKLKHQIDVHCKPLHKMPWTNTPTTSSSWCSIRSGRKSKPAAMSDSACKRSYKSPLAMSCARIIQRITRPGIEPRMGKAPKRGRVRPSQGDVIPGRAGVSCGSSRHRR